MPARTYLRPGEKERKERPRIPAPKRPPRTSLRKPQRHKARPRRKRKRVFREDDTLLGIAEEEYGDSDMAGDIARANPNIRNYTGGVVINLPEPEPDPEPHTYIDPSLRRRAVPPPAPLPPRRELDRPRPRRGERPALPAPVDFGFGSPLATPVAATPAPPQPVATPFAGMTSPVATPAGPPAPPQGVQAGPYGAPGPGGTQLFEYDEEGRPFAVVGVTGEVSYGTSIVPYLIEQGVAPLIITPYDIRMNGIDVNLLTDPEYGLGYVKDDWGNYLAPSMEEAPLGGTGLAGGGGGGYGYGGGGGRRGGGGGGRAPSYTGRERLNMLAHGAISWRM